MKAVQLHQESAAFGSAGDNVDLGLIGIDPTIVKYDDVDFVLGVLCFPALVFLGAGVVFCSTGGILCDPEAAVFGNVPSGDTVARSAAGALAGTSRTHPPGG